MNDIGMPFVGVLEDLNPWWSDRSQRRARRYPVRRDAQPELHRHLLGDDRRALLLLGPRQVGKTTMLLQLADDLLDAGWPPGNLTYFDFSDDRLPSSGSEDLVSARQVAEFEPTGCLPDHPKILLLDEIRLAPSWDRWLKGAVDRGASRILATDSAASLLRQGSRESGQGRWDEVFLEGLTFREFSRMSRTGGGHEADDYADPAVMERYLELGGFPEHVLSGDFPSVRQRLRGDIVERAIFRDLAEVVQSPEPVRELFVYLMQESGGIFSAENRASDLGCDRRSAAQWLSHLEQTFLIRRLERHTSKPAATLRSRSKPKVYAADHGLVAAFSLDPVASSSRRAKIFEAVVFRHLRLFGNTATSDLSYYRDRKHEVDFVLRPASGQPLGIEVTSARPGVEKLAKLRAAVAALGEVRPVLIHGGLQEGEQEGVQLLPLLRFLHEPNQSLGVSS